MRTQPEIMKEWYKDETPLVSITCITYNHANYIHNAIEGFLIQKTNFPIEVLIHDDASTDGTEEIIREYEAKYPEIIKPLYETENQYVKGRKGSRTFNIPRSRSKYIALCEGDDYWTDPLKLQKQVDLLEANPDYGMVHTDLDEYNVTKKTWRKSIWKDTGYFQSGYIFNSLLIGRTSMIYACTTMFRKNLITGYLDDLSNLNLAMGDTFFWLAIATQGKVGYIPESTAVRQLLPNSATQGIDCKKKKAFLDSWGKLLDYALEKFSVDPDIYKLAKESLSLKYLELYHNCDSKDIFESKEIAFEGQNLIIEKFLYKLKSDNRYSNYLLRRILTLARALKIDYYSKIHRYIASRMQ